MTTTVTLTKEQVEALLDLLSYGEDYLESRIEDNEADPRNAPRWWRRDKTTLKHALAARRAIVMARGD